jgi:hypothetical protein
MKKDNLTTNVSNEAESPAFLVGAVIRGFIPCCKNSNIENVVFTYVERNTEKQKVGQKNRCLSCGKFDVFY